MPNVITDDEALFNISETVKLLRGDRSFADLARACCTPNWKCHPGAVEKVANARHMPRAGLLARIAETLATTTDAMIHGHHLRTKFVRVDPQSLVAKPTKKRVAKTKSRSA